MPKPVQPRPSRNLSCRSDLSFFLGVGVPDSRTNHLKTKQACNICVRMGGRLWTVTFGNCRRRLGRATVRPAVIGEWLGRPGFAQRGKLVVADPFDRGVDVAEALAGRLVLGAPRLVGEGHRGAVPGIDNGDFLAALAEVGDALWRGII